MSGVLLANSIILAVGTAVLATGVGGMAALATLGVGRRARGWMRVLGILALAMPPFLATSGWIRWFGLTGVGQGGVAAGIPQLMGAILILTQLYWPIAFFLVSAAWSRLEVAQLEAEPAARGWVLIRELLLPMAAPAALFGAVVILVLAMNHFAVPALLQVRVYPAEIWIQFNTRLDAVGALRSSWPMVVGPLLLMIPPCEMAPGSGLAGGRGSHATVVVPTPVWTGMVWRQCRNRGRCGGHQCGGSPAGTGSAGADLA